ncbi:hypothetical protein CGK93_14035 [Arthrobacter sp. YN]|nr:hypothetical protein CGK93_14035 [Arthrobacter sp. YN]
MSVDNSPRRAGGGTVVPEKCKQLVSLLVDGGWSFVLNHGIDTGSSPFVTVEARRRDDHVMVTWHTRATGTYRLFSCMFNRRDVSLTRLQEVAP